MKYEYFVTVFYIQRTMNYIISTDSMTFCSKYIFYLHTLILSNTLEFQFVLFSSLHLPRTSAVAMMSQVYMAAMRR